MSIEDDYRRATELLAAGDPAGELELRVCASLGHAPACHRLAMAGLPEAGPAPAEVLALLRTAAGAGHARACFQLGLLHAQGRAGGATDLAEARRWCMRAAELGLAVAQFNLGLLASLDAGADPEEPLRWLRLAAVNDVPEAEACLTLLYREGQDADGKPRTWAEADTRASVALARSDPDAPKTVRFSEYYVDPCLDLLARRLSLRREEVADIVQQFFLELEEPLSKGAHQGRLWKESLRTRFDPGKGRFRSYLGRALVNFARDHLRRRQRERKVPEPARPEPDLEALRHCWLAELERFQAEAERLPGRPARAARILVTRLAEDVEHQAQAERLGLDLRTIRRDVLLAGELLRDWLAAQVAGLADGTACRPGLEQGLALVPEWLHWLSADKRRRLLSYLVLLNRARG